MTWKKLLAYISGSVDEELLKRNEYLVTENRIFRAHIEGRLRGYLESRSAFTPVEPVCEPYSRS